MKNYSDKSRHSVGHEFFFLALMIIKSFPK